MQTIKDNWLGLVKYLRNGNSRRTSDISDTKKKIAGSLKL